MSMNINTNLSSIFIQRTLTARSVSIGKLMQRLSTGIRINSAADDAAGLSLSTKLESKVSGLEVANKNIQTGVSKIQTYEVYLGNMAQSVQRIRDLAVQASN